MSIWGKILGGAAGFAMGGPIGAILGAMAGHSVDTGFAGRVRGAASDAQRQITFTIGVIALSAKMAKADGHVTRDEVDAFKRLFQVPAAELNNVGRVFDMARQSTDGYEAYANQLAKAFEREPAVLGELLDLLFYIAGADGVYHPSELDFVQNVARIFGFSDVEYEAIAARHTGVEGGNPYAVLGVDPSISDADLKKAYRGLVRKHHPDKLVAQGMPEEFIDKANDRLAAINTAYDVVAKSRGMN